MKLQVGERLAGSGPSSHASGYVVTGVVTETRWYGLYTGKKIFYNFDFTSKRPRETEEKEWLDVYLRTINYPYLDDPEYVAGRRALARAEARRVLGSRSSNLWPEPLDLLEMINTRDPFTFARDLRSGLKEHAAEQPGATDSVEKEPIVVFARPHGEPLARWQQGILPLGSVMAVLAELLDFIRAAHNDGLLLNGLGPSGVIVDRAGRAHYLATDMVVEMPRGTRLNSHRTILRTQQDWARFFPPERYWRGFSPPECFDPTQPRDRRSDLYAWATLAYLLLTGDRPVQLALEQGLPWAHFQEPQFSKLEKALRSLPPVHVRNWAEQLGVESEALVKRWPRNFLAILQLCLRAEPRQRPASVADLRAWLLAPPPSPMPSALVVRFHGRPNRVFMDIREMESGLEVVVRRGLGFLPITTEEGEAVHEGPPAFWVDDAGASQPETSSAAEVQYAVFTRSRRAGVVSCSVATPAPLLDTIPASIRAFAEAGAPPGASDEPETARVSLLFRILDPIGVAEALLTSALPQARGWAIRRLGAAMKKSPRPPGAEALLWRALQDPAPALRMDAVRGLLEGAERPSEALVRRLVQTLGAGNLDESIQAAWALKPLGVDEEIIRKTVAQLEGERPANCPECGIELAGRNRPLHLISVHGYVDVFGAVQPRAIALTRLWDRVFSTGDVSAHDRLCEILLDEVPSGQTPSPYAASLEGELEHRAEVFFAARWQEMPRLVRCLHQSAKARPHFLELLRASDRRVREVGRELLLPDLAEKLEGEHTSAAQIRQELDALCADDLIEEKILLGLRLPHFGVDAAAAETCVRQLQEERPVPCPQCQQPVVMAELETHLRRAHRLYQFRGAQRSPQDTIAALLSALCGTSPDYLAWRNLEEIARDEYGARADDTLVSWLGHKLAGLSGEKRAQAVGAIAEAINAAGSGLRLVPLLASSGAQIATAHLTLALVIRLPAPVDLRLIDAVKPLLSDHHVPRDVRLDAAAALLRTTGKTGKGATDVLTALIAQTGKARGIERLRELEQRVGTAPAIDALCAELEDLVRMQCPHCSIQLRRPEMASHLWEQHRLVLDGRRVRKPWKLIEDWIEDYRLERDPEVLARCRELAQRLDPENGEKKMQRLLLQHGIEDARARDNLTAEARQQHASLCPHCFALVPVRDTTPPAPLSVWRGRLSARGYRVEVTDEGLVPWLEIETPEGMIYRDSEPGRRLTRKGATLFLVGPPVVAALVLAILLTAWNIPALVPVSGVLILAVLLALFVFFGWRNPVPPVDRAVNHAWTMLVPQLHSQGFSLEDSAFVSGLAQASSGHGDTRERAHYLKEIRLYTERAVTAGAVPVSHLACLWRLTAEDLAKEGMDPVLLLVEQVGRCFEGTIPLSFAGQMLQRWDQPWWTEGQLARLRVLLLDRAFEAGLEVRDILDVGRATPTLGTVLNVEDLGGLARLRLLWSLRASRPWDRRGQAFTAFEVAAAGDGAALLATFPDLLLAVRSSPPLYLCGRGLWFLDTWFPEMPLKVEVLSQSGEKGGYQLVVGDDRFWFPEDPDVLAGRLERWFRYYFRDFVPQVAAVHRWLSPVVARTLRAQNAVQCPECQQAVLTREGEVGITMEEPTPDEESSPHPAGQA
jgi:hypothetical protein